MRAPPGLIRCYHRVVTPSASPPRILIAATREGSARSEVDWVSPLVVVPRFADMKRAVGRLGEFRTIALTSAHAVDALIGALRAVGQDVRALFGLRLAVVGEGSAERLSRYGLVADLVAQGGGAALASELITSGLPDPILHPRALDGRTELADALTAAGRRVEVVPAYETMPDGPALKAALLRHAAEPYAAFAFASPSGAHALIEAFGGTARLRGALIGAIGPTTEAELKALGFVDIVVPVLPSLDALVDVLAARIA